MLSTKKHYRESYRVGLRFVLWLVFLQRCPVYFVLMLVLYPSQLCIGPLTNMHHWGLGPETRRLDRLKLLVSLSLFLWGDILLECNQFGFMTQCWLGTQGFERVLQVILDGGCVVSLLSGHKQIAKPCECLIFLVCDCPFLVLLSCQIMWLACNDFEYYIMDSRVPATLKGRYQVF